MPIAHIGEKQPAKCLYSIFSGSSSTSISAHVACLKFTPFRKHVHTDKHKVTFVLKVYTYKRMLVVCTVSSRFCHVCSRRARGNHQAGPGEFRLWLPWLLPRGSAQPGSVSVSQLLHQRRAAPPGRAGRVHQGNECNLQEDRCAHGANDAAPLLPPI